MRPSSGGTPIPELTPGSLVAGKYRVTRRLGEGGMGVVVAAEHVTTQKRVAIKWLHPAVAGRPEAVQRMIREAQATARIRHPNVVDVYDVSTEEGAFFLVMELLEGEPLSALMERGGEPPHALIAMLLEAMRGVAAAHARDIVHRDIKPDNIFLARVFDSRRRIPKVVDFGISKVLDTDALSLTRTGTPIGTPAYMSYEQLHAVPDIDARTDVYAFGVILYEALTGQIPFEADTLPELILKISEGDPAPPNALCAGIPGTLAGVIARAMARDRDARTPTLARLIEELTPFATEASFRAQMTVPDAPLPGIPGSRPPDRAQVDPYDRTVQPPSHGMARAASTAEPAPAGSHDPVIIRHTKKAALAVGGAAALLVLGTAWLLRAPAPTPAPGEAPAKVDAATHGAAISAGHDGDLPGHAGRPTGSPPEGVGAVRTRAQAVTPAAHRLTAAADASTPGPRASSSRNAAPAPTADDDSSARSPATPAAGRAAHAAGVRGPGPTPAPKAEGPPPPLPKARAASATPAAERPERRSPARPASDAHEAAPGPRLRAGQPRTQDF